jgi:sec-independent protein translocase protein TatA
MSLGPLQLVIILVIVLLLFGRNKIPQLMGDVAKGIKSFKKGMKEDDTKDESIDNKTDEEK